jgi:pentapeptide repeat protein
MSGTESNEAAFIVADLTGANPNVYYELGLAHTVGTETLPLIQRGEQIPFDQRSYRIVVYDDTEGGHHRLSGDLAKRIEGLTFDSTPQLMLKNERVGEFNRWRQRGLPTRFGGDHFGELDLRAVDLSRGYLSETNFRLSTLDDARFQGATLIRADFTSASLRSADLSRANVSEAIFEGAQMQGANLEDGIALRVELSGVDMTGSNVAGLRIDEATYQRFRPAIDTAENNHRLIRER